MYKQKFAAFFNAIKYDLIAWCCLIAWETIILNYIFNNNGAASVYAVHYAITIGLFYFQALYVLPKVTTYRFTWFTVPLFFVVFLSVYILLHSLGVVFSVAIGIEEKLPNYGFNDLYLLRNAYRGLFFAGFSTGYFYIRRYILTNKKAMLLEIEKERTEKALIIAQNLYLKSQINPHFLFNVLHFINYRLKPGSEESEALLHLSNIMHFAFSSDQGGETIRIGEELTQVEELVALQELRGSRFTGLDVRYDLVVCELKIIPLVLLTLVENIYKHGDLSDGSAYLSLEGDEETECLVIKTSNTIGGTPLISDRTGMGNIAKRLENAYGSAVDFSYGRVGERFDVMLSLPFKLLQN